MFSEAAGLLCVPATVTEGIRAATPWSAFGSAAVCLTVEVQLFGDRVQIAFLRLISLCSSSLKRLFRSVLLSFNLGASFSYCVLRVRCII